MGRALLILSVGVLAAGPVGAADAPATLRIGLLQGMFRDVQPAVVAALAKPFQGLMEKQAGVTGDVELVADSHALARKLDAGQLDIGVMHGFEFAWAKDRHPELAPIVITQPHGRTLHACVVVPADSPAQALADLKGVCLSVPKGIKAHSLLYAEAARKGLPAGCAACPTGKATKTAEEVLNAVANGECEAALVDSAAFTGYQNLQPGAAKRLRLLCKSDDFPPSVVVYKRGKLDEGTVTRIRSGMLSAHATPQYKPLLLLWNLKGFDLPGEAYSAQLDATLKAYPAPVQTVPVSREK